MLDALAAMVCRMKASRERNICRLCLQPDGRITNIFYNNNPVEFVLRGAIEELLELKVVNETQYPWLLCFQCFKKVTGFYMFKQQCQENNLKLRNLKKNTLGRKRKIELKRVCNSAGGSYGREGSQVFVNVETDIFSPVRNDSVPSGENGTLCLGGYPLPQVKQEVDDWSTETLNILTTENSSMEGTSNEVSVKNEFNESEAEFHGFPFERNCLETGEHPEKDVDESLLEYVGHDASSVAGDILTIESENTNADKPQDERMHGEGPGVIQESEAILVTGMNLLAKKHLIDKNKIKKNDSHCSKTSKEPVTEENSPIVRIQPVSLAKNRTSAQNFNYNDSGIELNSKTSIGTHLNIKPEINAFHCIDCNLYFIEQTEYDKHNGDQHQLNRDEERVDDAVIAVTEDEVSSNKVASSVQDGAVGVAQNADVNCICRGLFTCSVCNEKFSKWDDYLPHAKGHLAIVYFCDVCRKEFQIKAHLGEHVKGVHMKLGDFTCIYCDEVFREKKHLKNHVRIHSKEKPNVCFRCRKEYSCLRGLRKHILTTHESQKSYICKVCSRGYETIGKLMKHKVEHRNKKPIACNICGRKFKFERYLRTHMKLHANHRPYACDLCPKTYYAENHLTHHMVSHKIRKSVNCQHCAEKFFTQGALKRHMRAHISEKVHACTDCGKTFKLNHHLVLHRRVHRWTEHQACFSSERRIVPTGTA